MRVQRLRAAIFLVMTLSCASIVPCEAPTPVQETRPDISSAKVDLIDGTMKASDIIHRLGPAHMDIGSGLHIYRWFTTDGSMVTISFADPCKRPVMFKLEPCSRTPCERINEGLGRN